MWAEDRSSFWQVLASSSGRTRELVSGVGLSRPIFPVPRDQKSKIHELVKHLGENVTRGQERWARATPIFLFSRLRILDTLNNTFFSALSHKCYYR